MINLRDKLGSHTEGKADHTNGKKLGKKKMAKLVYSHYKPEGDQGNDKTDQITDPILPAVLIRGAYFLQALWPSAQPEVSLPHQEP